MLENLTGEYCSRGYHSVDLCWWAWPLLSGILLSGLLGAWKKGSSGSEKNWLIQATSKNTKVFGICVIEFPFLTLIIFTSWWVRHLFFIMLSKLFLCSLNTFLRSFHYYVCVFNLVRHHLFTISKKLGMTFSYFSIPLSLSDREHTHQQAFPEFLVQ